MMIVKIISVIDTREYEEVSDGVWRAIPGSGNESECARCGRLHEVHATVQLEDDSRVVVGTGCMNSASLAKEARSLANAEKRRKQNEKTAEKFAAMHALFVRAKAEVEVLEVPRPAYGTKTTDSGRTVRVVRVGDAEAWAEFVTDDLATDTAIRGWKERRLQERGITFAHKVAARDLADLERRRK